MLFTPIIIFSGKGGFVYNKTISADTTNFNMKSDALANGWDGAVKLTMTVTVNSGIVVGSTSTGSYAFDTGANFPTGSTLTLINNGKILGKGGAGGNGTDIVGMVLTPTAGASGGPALNAQVALTVDNTSGIIGGGGGGGGGAGGYAGSWAIDCGGYCIDNVDADSPSGGGGQGSTNSSAGTFGNYFNSFYDCGTCTLSASAAATSGAQGTAAAAGTAGAGATWTGDCLGAEGLPSAGAGGSLGSNGGGGGSGYTYRDNNCTYSSNVNGASGGAAGACTQGNSNIAWNGHEGTRYGALN